MGQGVKENAPLGYEATVIRHCPHFNSPAPIMRDRANVLCIVNSDVFRGVLSDGESTVSGSGSEGGQGESYDDEEGSGDKIMSGDDDEENEPNDNEPNDNDKPDHEENEPNEEPTTQPPTQPNEHAQLRRSHLLPLLPTIGVLTTASSTTSGTACSIPTSIPTMASASDRVKNKKYAKKSARKKSKPTPAPAVPDWEARMLELETEKWATQKHLDTEKWATQKHQVDLEFNFELLKKYKELQTMGYDDRAIKVLVPAMSGIIAQVGGGNSMADDDDDDE